MRIRRKPSFHDHFMSLMLANTRPVQAIMGLCGLIAAAGLWAAQALHTWTPMDEFVQMTCFTFVMTCFVSYAVMSWTSALYDFHTAPWVRFKYAATCMGITLWTICLASSITWSDGAIALREGMNLLYIIPTSADVWVLIQMVGGVEKVERRR